MPSWKKIIVSGSDASLNSLYSPSITGSLEGTSSWSTNSISALTASYVNTLNQNVIVTSSMMIGSSSLGPSENTLTLGARDGAGEGGQLGLNASGGTYTSASMIDVWQNKFRVLRGTNAGSDATRMQIDLQTGQVNLATYTSTTAHTGTTLVGILGFDATGNILTTTVSTGGGGGLSGGGTSNYVAKWNGSTSLTDSTIYDNGTNVGIGAKLLENHGILHIDDNY